MPGLRATPPPPPGTPALSPALTSPPRNLQPQQSGQLSIEQPRGHRTNSQPTVIKPALTYRVLATVIENKDDQPGPRCGHTLTAVEAIGEEGSPSYVGPRLIVFGGARVIEESPSQAGTQNPGCNSRIRLASTSADAHCYNVVSNKWTRLQPDGGGMPSPRAAHAAAAVGTMVVIQGGISTDGLCPGDLHVLDLTQSRPRWVRVAVQGTGPGRRFGHVMALVGGRDLLVMGGNDGKTALADVWSLDTGAEPYEWKKLEPEGECPPPCMYATASSRGDGLLWLYGGRDASKVPLSSAYFLAKHQDGRWEWKVAPGISPAPRFQHAATFVNGRLHVSGGALGGGRWVEDGSNLAVLDTDTFAWLDQKGVLMNPCVGRNTLGSAGDAAAELTRRCRHAAASVGNLVYIYGGLRGGLLLDDLLVADDSAAVETLVDPLSNGRTPQTSECHFVAEAEDTGSLSKMPGASSLSKVHPADMEEVTTPVDVHLHHRAVGVAAEAGSNKGCIRLCRSFSRAKQVLWECGCYCWEFGVHICRSKN